MLDYNDPKLLAVLYDLKENYGVRMSLEGTGMRFNDKLVVTDNWPYFEASYKSLRMDREEYDKLVEEQNDAIAGKRPVIFIGGQKLYFSPNKNNLWMMKVPSEAVPFILGRRGWKIKRLQTYLQARVIVAKTDSVYRGFDPSKDKVFIDMTMPKLPDVVRRFCIPKPIARKTKSMIGYDGKEYLIDFDGNSVGFNWAAGHPQNLRAVDNLGVEYSIDQAFRKEVSKWLANLTVK